MVGLQDIVSDGPTHRLPMENRPCKHGPLTTTIWGGSARCADTNTGWLWAGKRSNVHQGASRGRAPRGRSDSVSVASIPPPRHRTSTRAPSWATPAGGDSHVSERRINVAVRQSNASEPHLRGSDPRCGLRT